MNLFDMRVIVRRDLHDEDAANYRWTTDEIDRHIDHAVKELSHYEPLEVKATLATVSASRDIDISSLTDRIYLHAVEYPVDEFPKRYQRYSLWTDKVTLLGDVLPDGSNAYFYYGKLHTLAVGSSTIPAKCEDLVSL